ncbi:MAG: deoxyribodipyrimidine photo-lyase [Rhodobacteraceae bacterium]|nr:deoxyribodipyrimidine photo-lyase [Paracoccaceae bacterium]
MTDRRPVIWWIRRDMRLSDNPALSAAVDAGGPVVPVFVLDEVVDAYGALPRWRMLLGAAKLADALEAKGSRLILRRGKALETLRALISETGARGVFWSRLVDPDARRRDEHVKAELKADGVEARSFPGHLLFEPWTVETKEGGPYKVFTPYWRVVCGREVGAPLATPTRMPAPETWPGSDRMRDWQPEAGMNRGAAVVAPHLTVGEHAARGRLGGFISGKVEDYAALRDVPAAAGTSLLSENLTHGEISVRTCWLSAIEAGRRGAEGAGAFQRELVWRDFAHHLAYHTPRLTTQNWREEWDSFPWSADASRPEVIAWMRGRTGIRLVDAAMRELYVTGFMHNRARMIVASYLTKHLMADWRIGQRWFAETLRDWDPASNAMGWQWVAGSGPDAAPYFRIFNPDGQAERFDPEAAYVDAWIAEGSAAPSAQSLSYFDAVPRRWDLRADDAYPDPVVRLDAGRRRALDAYEAWRS